MLQISMSGTVVLVHGAGGSVGSEVARSFAHAGASVHLTGRTEGTLMETTDAIVQAGHRARAHQLDVTHGQAVRQCVETVLETEGRIDVVYNAVTHEETQGTPLHELDVAAAERTLTTVAQVHLNTVSSVVSTMIKQRSGVIQTMVGYGPPFPLLGTTAIAWQTVEAIYRQFAVELGPYGIRVQRFRTGGLRE